MLKARQVPTGYAPPQPTEDKTGGHFSRWEDLELDTLRSAIPAAPVPPGCNPPRPQRRSVLKRPQLVSSAVGVIVSDADGTIMAHWKHDKHAQAPGTMPIGPVELRVTPCIRASYSAISDVLVRYQIGGAKLDIDAGLKLKRTDDYLSTSTRVKTGPAMGRLSLDIPSTTLIDRNDAFMVSQQAARSSLHPDSRRLTLTRDIVKGLEDAKWPVTTNAVLGTEWRGAALAMTLSELPRIAQTGAEIGEHVGYGTTIYGAPRSGTAAAAAGSDDDGTSKPPSAVALLPQTLIRPNGKFRTELEIRQALMAKNPLLRSSKIMLEASGHYSTTLCVPGGSRTPTNPTGMATAPRVALPTVSPSRLTEYVTRIASPTSLTVVACLREDDRLCGIARKTIETANHAVASGTLTALASSAAAEAGAGTDARDFSIVMANMAESRVMAEDFSVHYLPYFLMYYGGRLAYRGNVGGLKTRVAPDTQPWATLVVESIAKDMLHEEVLLRKQHWSWDLVLDSAAAAKRKRELAMSTSMSKAVANATAQLMTGVDLPVADAAQQAYDIVFVSADLPEADVAAIDRAFRSAKDARAGKVPLLVGMVTLSGVEGATAAAATEWENNRRGITYQTRKLLPGRLADVVDVAVTKPLKSIALDDLADLLASRNPSSVEKFRGLTLKGLARCMIRTRSRAQQGVFAAGGK